MDQLMSQLGIMGYRLKSSIKVGEIWLPPSQISGYLNRFTRPLLLTTGDELHPFGVHGSATFIKFQTKFFAVFTKHQADYCGLQNIGFGCLNEDSIAKGGQYFLNNRWETGDADCSDELVFLDVSDGVGRDFFEPSEFFDLSAPRVVQTGENVVFGVAYGLCHADQKLEYDESGALDFRMTAYAAVTREVLCSYHGEGFDDTLASWEPQVSWAWNPKGLSGGAIFCIVKDSLNFQAKFCGVVSMGTEARLNSIKSDSILRHLRNICNNLGE